MDFHGVELRCLANASEDPDRVKRAILNALGASAGEGVGEGGEGRAGEMIVREEHAEGQFGNPIIIFTCRVEKRRQIRAYWEHMAARGRSVLEDVRDQVGERLDDELVLHFRLDKQRAYRGLLALGSGGDTVAVRCKPEVYSGGREGAVRELRAFLDGLLD
jgi:RNA binding exosome subunit